MKLPDRKDRRSVEQRVSRDEDDPAVLLRRVDNDARGDRWALSIGPVLQSVLGQRGP